MRKQVFLETWYEREKNRFADALPLLAPDGGLTPIYDPVLEKESGPRVPLAFRSGAGC